MRVRLVSSGPAVAGIVLAFGAVARRLEQGIGGVTKRLLGSALAGWPAQAILGLFEQGLGLEQGAGAMDALSKLAPRNSSWSPLKWAKAASRASPAAMTAAKMSRAKRFSRRFSSHSRPNSIPVEDYSHIIEKNFANPNNADQ